MSHSSNKKKQMRQGKKRKTSKSRIQEKNRKRKRKRKSGNKGVWRKKLSNKQKHLLSNLSFQLALDDSLAFSDTTSLSNLLASLV